jgi:DNA-binding MarR family transcriptional regulator
MKRRSAQPVDKDYQLWIMLEQARAAMLTAREKELAKYDTSAMKAAVLFIADSIGSEATPAEISRWILRRPHTVSGILDRMEKDGLINKTKDLERKNMVRVTLTERGKKALQQSGKRESIRRSLTSLSEGEKKELYIALEKIRDRALKVAAIPKPPYP